MTQSGNKRSRVKKGDQVIVMAGRDRGKRGRVLEVRPRERKVRVEGVAVVKRHQRPNPAAGRGGGIIDKEALIDISNVQLIDPANGKPTRILRTVPIKGLAGTVDDINQSLNAFATMERGVGVLFKTRNPGAIESLTRNLLHRQSGRFQLVKAKVVEVRHTGLGHRVCVDTTTPLMFSMSPRVTGWRYAMIARVSMTAREYFGGFSGAKRSI